MNHAVDEHVGKRFRALRKERGLSQTAVAEALGLTFQQVQKYERGTNRVSASKLYDTAKLFGLPIEAFFEGLPDADSDGENSTVVEQISTNPEIVRLVTLFLKTPPKMQKQMLKLLEAAAEIE